ncbi:DUF3800 domain-containing protein [Candidatus Nitrotoga sp. M5]|uniref:DUF3800 domain-containing protein n=1 Tax=Candidatus Nitrotoga sp. M5 TaxID=2890409 RepID=UPI001EF4FE7D|nr:DUF3800 domain-containing protein [Candidatus Nitrotoga sp. M5]CAH1387973.1 conserved hypothetical protein [Candidatus Nitrotoga sp. M5]
MHIAIDDTYGPENDTESKFVTGKRRTHVAVVFPDEDAGYIREQITNCLDEIEKQTGVLAKEFHFVDIYNRNNPWNKLPEQMNLMLFEFFADIYARYRWPVYIQTIDDRTIADHDFSLFPQNIERLDISKREDLSLLLLLLKIKIAHKSKPSPINIFLDEGKCKPGLSIGKEIFHDWNESYQGNYCSSGSEPLLQIADFLAYSINRSTHLSTKKNRTVIDNWFISLIGSMQINSSDIQRTILPEDFGVEDLDEFHSNDRKNKGL